MTYALVESGVVVNLINLEPYNESDFPNAVKVGDLLVAIGDTYQNEMFYHDGVEARTAMQVALAEMNDMKTALGELGVETNGDE